MRIQSVRIKNFRAFKDVKIDFEKDYTCFVGENSVGKSTVLNALNIFFQQDENQQSYTKLGKSEFHQENIDEPIEITVTFSDLNSYEQQELSSHYRHGVIVCKTIAKFNKGKEYGYAEPEQKIARRGIEDFTSFFKAEKGGSLVPDLRNIYEGFKKNHPSLPEATKKNAMKEALFDYEAANPQLCGNIESTEDYYKDGKGLLEPYIRWIYIPAVKDVVKETVADKKGKYLEQILALIGDSKKPIEKQREGIHNDAIEAYEKALEQANKNSSSLFKSLEASIRKNLNHWGYSDFEPSIHWGQPDKDITIPAPVTKMSLKSPSYKKELGVENFGHGLQRAIAFTLLQGLAHTQIQSMSKPANKNEPKMIFACEEPEIYQHPPRIRGFYNTLQNLSTSGSQVMITTHHPFFVADSFFEKIRLVKQIGQNEPEIVSRSFDTVNVAYKKISNKDMRRSDKIIPPLHQILHSSRNEMFFSKNIVFVEGQSDETYITTYLHLMGLWEEYISQGTQVIKVHGKNNLLEPIIIAKEFGIPFFVVFDADTDRGEDENNKKIFEALGKTYSTPKGVFLDSNCCVWEDRIEKNLKEEIKENIIKNPVPAHDALTTFFGKNKKSKSLENLCHEIIKFGR